MSRLPGGFYPTPPPYEPFNAFGDNPNALTSLLQIALQGLTGGRGYAMMGVNDRNLFDRLEQQRLTFRHQRMVAEAAQLDQANVARAVGGIMQAWGMPFGGPQQEAANYYASLAPSILPFAAQIAPEFTDSLFGRRGSSTVFAHFAEQATRHRYNPITGTFEMPEGQANRLMSRVYQDMFAGQNYLGSPLPAGRTGQLMYGLQMQGLLPGQSLPENFGRLSPKDRDALLSTPGVQEGLEAMDVTKITKTLKDWSKSVEAMREIFGDAGRPDAPMQELLSALRTMTAGGTSQLNPLEVTSMVRQIRNLANTTGIGFQQATAMIEGAAGRAQQLGIEPLFGPIAAAEGLAFAQSLQTGRLAYQGWGQPDISTVVQARTALTTSAIASPQQNRVGLLMRLADRVNFAPGSDAANFLDAVRRGQTTFRRGGRDASLLMHDAEFAEMVAASSGGALTADEISFQSGNAWSNREATARNPFLLRSTLRLANQEFAEGTLAGFAASAFGSETAKTAGGQSTAGLDAVLGRAMGRAIMSRGFLPSFFQHGNEAARTAYLRQQIEQDPELRTLAGRDRAAAAFLRGSEAQRDLAYGLAYDTTASQLEAKKGITLPTYVHTLSIEQDEIASRASGVAWAQGQLQEALAPAGRGSAMRRFFESLQGPGAKDIPALALSAFGSVYDKDVLAALGRKDAHGRSFQDKIQAQMASLQAAEQALTAADGADRVKAADQLQTQQQAMQLVLRDFLGNFKDTLSDLTADPTSLTAALAGTGRLRERLAKGGVSAKDAAGYQADMALFFQSFQAGGANASALGTRGMEKLAEISKLQKEIEKGGLTKEDDYNLGQQQKLMTQLQQELEASKKDGPREFNIGRLILNDKDLGAARLELSGGEEWPD
jgi:hypothetical protein